MSPRLLLFLVVVILLEVAVGLVFNVVAYRRDRQRRADHRRAGYNGVVDLFTGGKLTLLKIRFLQLFCYLVLAVTPYLNFERVPHTVGAFFDAWRQIALFLSAFRLGIYTTALMVAIFLTVLAIVVDEITFQRAQAYQHHQAELLALMDYEEQDGTVGQTIDEGRGV